MPSRREESMEPLRFADDDDPDEIGGFTRGKRSYEDDEDEDGGWAINEDHSDRLWDSAEDVDDDEADEEGVTVEEEDTEEEEEEADLFGASPIRGRRGRPKGSGKKTEEPSIFAGAANVFGEIAGGGGSGPAAGARAGPSVPTARESRDMRGKQPAGKMRPPVSAKAAAKPSQKRSAVKKKKPGKPAGRKSGGRKTTASKGRGSRAKSAKRPAKRGRGAAKKASKRRAGRR